MANSYPVYRGIRGDGNCFYRAFYCSYIEMALVNNYATHFLRLIFELVRTKSYFFTDFADP